MTEIPNKGTYQKNRRYMAWCALGMMLITTFAIIISPERFVKVDSILMMMYGSLSALVGSYFGFANKNVSKN
tara:strand:+ start:273 stop:488 length:216 start_codon:yes stop_codon:yes gene_type:complete